MYNRLFVSIFGQVRQATSDVCQLVTPVLVVPVCKSCGTKTEAFLDGGAGGMCQNESCRLQDCIQ